MTILRSLLRQIVDNPSAAEQVGIRARQHIVHHFDQEVISEAVLRRIQHGCFKHSSGESIATREPKQGSTSTPESTALVSTKSDDVTVRRRSEYDIVLEDDWMYADDYEEIDLFVDQ